MRIIFVIFVLDSTDRNGSHFKFTESVFKFITSCGEKPKEKLPEAPPKKQ